MSPSVRFDLGIWSCSFPKDLTSARLAPIDLEILTSKGLHSIHLYVIIIMHYNSNQQRHYLGIGIGQADAKHIMACTHISEVIRNVVIRKIMVIQIKLSQPHSVIQTTTRTTPRNLP